MTSMDHPESAVKKLQWRILIIGSNGMLARELMERLKKDGIPTIGLDLPQIDITKPQDVYTKIAAASPNLVINCAAYTDVDRAEVEPDKAFAVNRDGAASLAGSCRSLSVPLIHISTDYVFDGKIKRAYREDDPTGALNTYGRSKWEGEESVRHTLNQHLIVRTSWLYGKHGRNFVKTILKLTTEKEELRVIDDQHGSPTWAGDLADALITLSSKVLTCPDETAWGTYHFCNDGVTTWYGFAEAILEETRYTLDLKTCPVLPITTAEYPTLARRPAWSQLDCSKIERFFHIKPRPWRMALHNMVKDLLQRYQNSKELF